MKTQLLIPSALLLATLLGACGEKAAKPASAPIASSPQATSAAGDAAADNAGVDAPDRELQRGLEQIAAKPIRLLSEGETPKASIAPNGDFTIGGKPVAIDDAQRARLIAYRAQLVAITQMGVELSSRGAGVLTDKIGDAIGRVFEGDSLDEAKNELKAEGKKLDAVTSRLCDTLPALLREQETLATALPAFKPYAHFTQSDKDACRSSVVSVQGTAEKIGKTVGAGIGNPFKGGIVAGYLTSDAEHARKSPDPAKSSPASPIK
jgi:hypothetical protein